MASWDYLEDELNYLEDTENYIVSPLPITVEELEVLSQNMVDNLENFAENVGLNTKVYVDSLIADLSIAHEADFSILETAISNLVIEAGDNTTELETLRTQLNNEILRAQNAESVNADEIARIETKSETLKADNERLVLSLSGSIATAVSERGTDTTNLTNEINNILSNEDGTLNSLAEIKVAFESADSDLYEALSTLATNRAIILNAFIEQYNTKVSELETEIANNQIALATEIARSTNNNTDLIASVLANTNARIEAEGLIQIDITSLIESLNNLNSFGSSEITRLEGIVETNKSNQLVLNAVWDAKLNALYNTLSNTVKNRLMEAFNSSL